MSNTDSAPDATSAAYREGWAAEDARQGMPQGVANPVQTGEDFPGGDDDVVLAKLSFTGRLMQFLQEQPDVADATEVGGGIFGFRLAGLGDVNLSVNPTGTLDW